jgi:hypothetical protein
MQNPRLGISVGPFQDSVFSLLAFPLRNDRQHARERARLLDLILRSDSRVLGQIQIKEKIREALAQEEADRRREIEDRRTDADLIRLSRPY